MDVTNNSLSNISGNTSLVSSDVTNCVLLPNTTLELTMKTLAILIVLLMALIGNSMVLAVIKKNSRIRTTVNYLILNMAVSELLVPVVVLPRRISRLYHPGNFQVSGALRTFICKFPYFCENLSAAVSIQSLVLLAVERYHAVVFPFKPPLMGDKIRFVSIGLSWFLGIAVSSSTLYTYKLRVSRSNNYCIYSWEPTQFRTLSAFKYELVFFCLIFIVLPFIITSFCYIVIICALNREKSSTQLATQDRERRAKENRQITFMSLLVLAMFLLAWVPNVAYLFILTFSWNFKRKCGLESFQFISDFLTFTYPAVNPIIYYCFNEKFRQGFRELFNGRRSKYCFCCRTLRITAREEFDLAASNTSNTMTTT